MIAIKTNEETNAPAEEERDEGGFVLVWALLLMFALLLFAGFAVDVGAWYFRAAKVQRAADAAALAGSTYLPGSVGPNTPCDDPPQDAVCAAIKTAAKQGFPASKVTASVDPNDDRRLNVTITDNMPMFFSRLIMNNLTVTKKAAAVYARGVPLGSPENVFGTGNLTLPGLSSPRGYWAAVNGYCTAKEDGDEFLSAFDGNIPLPPPAGVSAGNYRSGPTDCVPGDDAPGAPGTNDEYDMNGYTYDIDVPAGHSTVTVGLYDPYFTPTVAGTHDRAFLDNASLAAITTVFTLEDPDGTVRCTGTYGTSTSVTMALACNDANASKSTISAGEPAGVYRLRVRVWAPQQNSYGTNTFSIGAVTNVFAPSACTTIGGGSNCANVYGEDAMSILLDASGTACGTDNCATFYLAQIDAASAGKPLVIDLWDPGDGAKNIQILRPDGTVAPFTYWAKGNYPAGSATSQLANDVCAGQPCLDVSQKNLPPIANGRSGKGKFSDDLVEITVPIPRGYNATANDGWWQIKYTVPQGQPVADRTTWQVRVDSNPVHLVPAT